VKHWDTTYAKTNQHCQAEDCLASIWNDLPQEFTDKAILSFLSKETSILCYCSWRTLWTIGLNTERAADIHYRSVRSVDEKVVQSLIRYYVRLTEYSGRDCMFTWKNEL